MGHDEMTQTILQFLRRPNTTQPARLRLVDGKTLTVRFAGIECFGELRSVEVIEDPSGQKRLIPYRDIAGFES